MSTNSLKKCVVLVPVGGAIEPGCETGLRTLEKRGYEVRRIRGYSQIDVGRNEIATGALKDGFDELIWIDSDVVFNADDVERLRSHDLPFVCGIYAKKNRREFACNFLPGTEKVVFGADGGLTEILYAGFGFVHTRRSLYETIRQQCPLDDCNQKFRTVVVPYFMPFIIPHGDEAHPDAKWYLGEDYAFCERARQCGFKIMLDTRIRLWHVGSYTFGWEDAGSDKQRYDTYTYHFGPQVDAPQAKPVAQASPVQKFALRHPWPQQKPDVVAPGEGQLVPGSKSSLEAILSADSRIVVALGASQGASTRFIGDCAANATIVAIDPWTANSGQTQTAKTDQLYKEFLNACWSIRQRVIPFRSNCESGLRELHASEVVPDLIFVEGDRAYQSVMSNVALSCLLFPKTVVGGEGWDLESVRRAVTDFSLQSNRTLASTGTAWKLSPRVVDNRMISVQKRFCLFTTGRAGSTSLMNALGQFDDIMVPHKQIDCEDDEILHSDHIARYMQLYRDMSGKSVSDELSLIDAFYAANSRYAYAGFKSMPDRHKHLNEFVGQDNLMLITLRRADIPSTVASFLTAFDTGQWRRDGGDQTYRLTFGSKYEQPALAHLRYIEKCEKLLHDLSGAIHLRYEDLCSNAFRCEPLDEFFHRHIQLHNPKPPTSASTYVENWDEFCEFIRENREWVWE